MSTPASIPPSETLASGGPQDAAGWRVRAAAHELRQEYEEAFAAYEQALRISSDPAELAGDLGRMAHRLGLLPEAIKFLTLYRSVRPDCVDGLSTLACVLRDQHRYDEAIYLIKTTIQDHPGDPTLWNTLGGVLATCGDPGQARTFFNEALRLAPDHAAARYNLACAELDVGEVETALRSCELAMAAASTPAERASMAFAYATMLLCAGRLGEGWDAYEARLDPDLPDAPIFDIGAVRWRPDQPLPQTLLIVAEQGLGDEILFAGMIPDVLAEASALIVAVEPRLVDLFRRSFPGLQVIPHASRRVFGRRRRWVPEEPAVDAWTPLASLTRRYRRALDAFPDRDAYLRADPARVEHWRRRLARLPGRKVGLLWRGGSAAGARAREYCPFAMWEPVLRTPDTTFVSLQYGDCAEELALARRAGLDLVTPLGLDLREDIEEVAALASALGRVIGPFNATTNLAAACGAKVWFVSAPMPWTQLGTTACPWYPRAEVLVAERHGRWGPVMEAAAAALGAG